MGPVLTRHAPEPVLRLRRLAAPIVAVILFVALLFGLLRLVEPPTTVDAIRIENRTSYGFDVGVTDGSNRGQLLLAGIDPASTSRVEDVLDQGDTWLFRVTRAGTIVGTIERSRDRLRADGWRVVIPASWDDRVQEAASG